MQTDTGIHYNEYYNDEEHLNYFNIIDIVIKNKQFLLQSLI